MAKLGDLIVRVGADTRGLNSALGNVKKKMRQDAGNLKELGRNLSRSVTAPLLGMGALAIKAATDFEFSMAKVQAVSKFTGEEMEVMENQAKELGATTSRSASEVAELQLELAKLGRTSTEIEQMTESVLSLSIAFDTELGETARVVGATLNQFGLDASESGRIADNMATLFGSSALDLEKFDTAMRTVGPTASAMGLSVEEAGAALGILVNAGVDASTAGTALTKSLTTLAKEGMTGAEAIEFLTTNNLSVADAFEKFGDRAGKIIPILRGTSGAFEDLTQKQIEGTGAALEARKILEDTAMGGFDRMKSSVEALGIAFGEVLLPVFNAITKVVAALAIQLSTMSKTSKTFAIIVGTIVSAIGPLLYIMPSLVIQLRSAKTAVLGLNAAMLTNPYVLATAAIVGLVAAAVALANHTGTAADEVRDLRGELAGLDSDKAKREASEKQVEAATAAYEEQKKVVEGIRAMMRVGDAMDQKMHARTLVRQQESLKLKEQVRDGVKKEHEALLQTQQMSVLFAKLEATKVKPAIEEVNEAVAVQGETLGMLINRLEETQVAAVKAADPKALGSLINMLEETQVAAFNAGEGLAGTTAETMTLFESLVSVADVIGAAFGSAFASIVTGAKSGKDAIVEMTKAIIMAALAGSQAAIIEAMINSGKFTGPAAPFVIPALVASGIALVGGLFSAIPAFADGGIVSGPTLGLVGEYPGASTNPEVIAPLDKLRSMLGGQSVMVTGKISGRDILLTSERNAIDRNRVRGF